MGIQRHPLFTTGLTPLVIVLVLLTAAVALGAGDGPEPIGLILRRMTYTSMMPDSYFGYSQQPVELFGVAPVGKQIEDLFPRDPENGDYLTLVAMDVYNERKYEIYWGDENSVRRRGSDATLTAICQSPGRALVLPSIGQFFVPEGKPYTSFVRDYFEIGRASCRERV